MQLTVLVDNSTLSYGVSKPFFGEPGFSCYIEDEKERILFDTGRTDLVIKNAEKMGIDLTDVTKIVLSHGHDDHTGGIPFLPRMQAELIAHPSAFIERIENGKNSGCPLTLDKLKSQFKVISSSEPLKISSHFTFLGEIPSLNDFEIRKQFGTYSKKSEKIPDYVMDDSALVYENNNGIYIITGCSHSGICNIVEYAQKLFKKQVIGIIGGFHMNNIDSRLEKTIAYLKSQNVHELMPCHCTSFPVRCAINKVIPVKEVGVGTKIVW